MELAQHSVAGRGFVTLWIVLATCYEHSILAALFRGSATALSRCWAGSALRRPFAHESTLSRSWEESVFCNLLGMLFNLPLLLLRKLYRATHRVANASLVVRFGFGLVADTSIAVGWLMLGILVIPYAKWNNAYSFIGFALLLVFAIFAGVRKKRRRLDVLALGPYTVFFAGFIFLAVPLSAYTNLSARFLLYHLSCMLCVLVVVSCIENAAQLRRLAGMASCGLLITSLYGIVQAIQGVAVNPSYVDMMVNKDMPGRVYSMFENPNAFAEVLALLIPVAVGLMFAAQSWGGRLLGLCSAGAGTVAILLTYSRASWVGLAVAALLFIFLWNKKLLPALLLLAIAVIPILPDSVFNRILTIFNFEDSSTSSRFPLYEAGGRLLQERPLQGAGLGIDAVRTAVSELNLYHGKSPFVHCHNIYLQVWAETGIFGLLSFLGAVGWAIKRGGNIALHKLGGSSSRMLIIGAISALLGIMVCGMADFIWHYPRVMLIFWFVFALAAAGIRLALREENRQGKRSLRHETH